MKEILEDIFRIRIRTLKMRIQVNCFRTCMGIGEKRGYELVNADCTIIAQKPKMAPHIEQMKE